MKMNRKKLLGISIAAVIVLILLPVILFVVRTEFELRSRLLSTIESPLYRIEIYYFPGSSMGTNPKVRVFSEDESGSEQLLVHAEARDTASAFFVDSVTAAVILYSRYLTKPWDRYPCDTFYFRLDKTVVPVRLRAIAP